MDEARSALDEGSERRLDDGLREQVRLREGLGGVRSERLGRKAAAQLEGDA